MEGDIRQLSMDDIQLIDVSHWRLDEDHPFFPVGARDKRMLWSPPEAPASIKPDWPYLFKSSRKAYPDQYWMEVIAYMVGQAMGIEVPKAFPAELTENGQKEPGALLEWFYDPRSEGFIYGRDLFLRINPAFDNDKGIQHNLHELTLLCRAIAQKIGWENDWKKWLLDMLVFDSLIGNTDRHQENWGVVVLPSSPQSRYLLSPFFDNGTSLGHERFPERVAGWDEQRIDAYVRKGAHHLRYERENTKNRVGHFDSINMSINDISGAKDSMLERLDFDFDNLTQSIENLCSIQTVVPLTTERAEWTIKVLRLRHKRLMQIVNCND